MSTPILPNAVWLSGTNENSIPANDNSLRAEILNGLVLSDVVTAQPVSPGDGDIYIIPSGATGSQWSTFTLDDLTIYRDGTWYAYAPVDGVVVNISGGQLQYLGSFGWTPMTALNNPMTTAGDLIVGGVSGTPERLAIGTNGQVLTVSGGAVAWGAGGGGGLTNWTDAVNTSSPNATIPVVSLSATNAATNVDAVVSPKGTGGFALQVADGTTTGGNKRGRRASDFQITRSSAAAVAGADDSFAAGTNNTIASTASNSAVFGSTNNIQSGSTNAFCAGMSNSLGPNANYSAAFGTGHSITARYSGVFGNANTVAEGCFSWGQQCDATANFSAAMGFQTSTRAAYGLWAMASGRFAANGDAQERRGVLRRSTTNATPAVLTSDASAPGADDQFVLPNASAFLIRGDIVARENATGDCKSWEFRVTIKRGANAAATAIVGSAIVTVADADAGAAAWTIGLSADTTNGALSITATGEAAKTIRWVGRVTSVEVAG